ncbi:MAG TPA: oligoendopeptidase F [Chloroflexota bacterium]|nr:oligoendopeptidase F [Chloroflexota bacterium]
MAVAVPPRSEIPTQYTWDTSSIFPTTADWEEAVRQIEGELPHLESFAGRLGEGPDVLAAWLELHQDVFRRLGQVFLYANSEYNVNTLDEAAKARQEQAQGLMARATAAASFAEPEILAIGDTLQRWMREDPRLQMYAHYFDILESRRSHIRSAEVEQILGLVRDPFSAASGTHRTLTDTDLPLGVACTETGDTIPISQGNVNALLSDSDREVRRTAWESYADAHLAFKHTMANALAAGIKQDVFNARARKYPSSLEAALGPNHIPVEVFHNLIATYRRNLPIWHRYWNLRRRALGYDELYVYDIKAPLSPEPPSVSVEQAAEWISEGMRPLGDEYADILRRGVLEERWVDIMPNQGKRSGAYSSGTQGTHPFILMSYSGDLYGLSTLAHELGHSMHSYYSTHTQPFIYTRYGLFLAEVASTFNQALVRAYLMGRNPDPVFQIALIEEAMSNFHRYFFIMPALARFELAVHEQVERGKGLTADGMIGLMADIFKEGYGDEVVFDRDRIGITWAQFSGHLYMNFYVFQYATGISAAHALARGVLEIRPNAAEKYLGFLKSGGSEYPLETLRRAGVDMMSPQPVQDAFDVLNGLVDRLERLLEAV